MSMELQVQVRICWGEVDENGNHEHEWHYWGHVAPPVGSHFSAWTQKDEEGSYLNDSILGSKGRPIVSGRVIDLKYHWEGRGQNRNNWSETMWVFVILKADEVYNT